MTQELYNAEQIGTMEKKVVTIAVVVNENKS